MWNRRRFGFLLLAGLLLTLFTPLRPASAQTTVQIGGFNIQFWDPADGAAYIPGGTIPANQISLFSAAEIDAITRALNYWSDVLNLTAADMDSPVLRIVNWTAPNSPNAFAAPVVTGGQLNTISRLQGGMPARDMGLDGGIAFLPDGIGFETDMITQFPNGSFNMEMVAIHEIGHLLGVALTVHDPFNALVVGNTFTGANAVSVYGGAGIPLAGDGGHTAIPYENITRGLVLGQDFRNIPHASPAELAILADLGFGVVLSDNFGEAFYQDNEIFTSAMSYSPGNDFGIGLYLLADNLDITQNHDLTASGYAGTGIRIVGEFNNLVTVGTSSNVSANGDFGIGILASGGANHDIVVRGDVSATGMNGVGIRLDFGDPFIFPSNFINSTSYNAPLVNSIDITGSVTGSSRAIWITNSAGLNELNIMNGASISGDIVSDAIISAPDNLVRPTISFGRLADANGQATAAADAGFNFTYSDDITGTTRFDAQFVGGTTNLNGTSAFNDSDIFSGATLATTGMITSNTIDVMDSALLLSNGTVNTNTLNIMDNASAISNGVINGGSTDVGDGATLLSNGTVNATSIDLFDGALLDVNGTVNSNSLNVMSGATVISNGTINAGLLTVEQNTLLQGNGFINSTNAPTINGTVAPGNSIGTLNFGNSQIYSPASTLEIEVQPSAAPVPGTDNDLINVFGSATFNGGVVDIQGMPPNGAYAVGTSYTYVQTTGGVLVNATPTLMEDLDNVRVIPFFTQFDAGFWIANETPYLPQARTFNQRAVAGYLDAVALDLMNPDIQTLRDNLDLMTSQSELRNALDQLSGEIYATTSILQILSSNQMLNRLSDQVNHNHLSNLCCRQDLWYTGYGNGIDSSGDGNAHDTDLDVIGHLVGKSWCIGPQTIIGGYYNYEDQRVTALGVGSEVQGESHRLGMYARNQAGVLHTLVTGFVGWNDMESTRNVRVNMISETNQADYNAHHGGLYYENGLTYARGLVSVQPFGSLQYLRLETDNFTESGGPVTALNVDGIELDSFRTQLGGRASVFTPNNLVQLQVEGAWIYEAADTVADYSAALASAQSTRFIARGLDLGSHFFNVGPSLMWRLGNMNVFLEYQASIGDRGTLHTGQWGSELVW